MVTTCCVIGCKSEEYPGCDESFYSFPSDEELQTKWKNVIGLKGCVVNRKVCLLHFRKEDFIIKKGLPSLNENVIPIYVTPPFKMECDKKRNFDKLNRVGDENGDIGDTNEESQHNNCYNKQETIQAQNKTEIKVGEMTNPRCCCCLNTDKLRSLWRQFNYDGVTEIYGAMLTECFALSWNRPTEPDKSTEQICELCILRLRDAVTFKSEVLTSAKVLNEQVYLEHKIKQETVLGNDMMIQTEYLMMESDHFENDDDSRDQLVGGVDKFDEMDEKPDDPIKVIKLEPLQSIDPPTWNEASGEVKRTTKRRTRPIEAIPKRYKQYSAEDVQRAVEAVAERTMSQNSASKTFKVPVRVLAGALKSYVKIKQEAAADKTTGSKMASARNRTPRIRAAKEKKRQLYPEQNLLQAFEEVWNKRMTQTEASKFYKVPRSTIFDMINKNLGKPRNVKKKSDEGPQEMVKHTTNILTIMENSNATPIRCHGDGGYMCCFCNHQYQKPDDLKTHTLFCHDFKTKRTLTKGKRPSSYFVKLDISHLKCTLCNTDIDTLEKLIEHLIKEHEKPIYTDIKNHILPFRFETEELRCTVCCNAYNKFKLLQEHLNVHYQNYVCEVCNAGFVSRMILHNHTRGHKTGVFTCEICLKVYSTLRKLTYHKNLVHRHSYLVSKCGYCHQKFKSYQRKLEHLTEVHNVKPMTYMCKACNRSFNSQAGLRVHRKRDHLMERKYKCTDCDMEFFARAELNAHMLKHTGLREFQCDVCQKSFKRKFTLTEHMRIHENNCRFKCEQCGAAFVQKCSWRGHMRNKHGIIS